jgi:hypothetical protein
MSDETMSGVTGAKLLVYLEDQYGPAEATATPTDGAVTIDLVIDIGNSEVYAMATSGGKALRPLRMASLKSLRGANAAKLLAERGRPGDWKALAGDEHVVTVDGIDRYVGRLAAETATHAAHARGSEERYSDGWNLDYLYAAIGALTSGAAVVRASVVTGLPFDLWAAHQADVAKTIKGKHSFSYNGQPKTLTVTSVAVEREGVSAWHALPAEWRTGGPMLIIDWGGHTANIVVMAADGAIVDGMTQPVGCETILDDISQALPRPLTTAERAGLLVALRDGAAAFTIPHNGRAIDVLPAAAKHFDDAALTFSQKLKAAIPQAMRSQLSTIALVGGTAYAIGARLARHIPPLKLLAKDHEFANLLGNASKHGLLGGAKTTKKGK